MHPLPPVELTTWASQYGIVPDERFAPPLALSYQNGLIHTIPLPPGVDERAHVLSRVFSSLPSGPVRLWKRGGGWDYFDYPESKHHAMFRRGINAILHRLGVSPGDGGLYFAPDEREYAMAISYLNTAMAMHVRDDLFVLPDDGRWFIWLDHDGLLILCFRDQSVMSQMADSWSDIWNPAGGT